MKYLTALLLLAIAVPVYGQVSVATVFGHVKLSDPSEADNLTFGMQNVAASSLSEIDQPDSAGNFEFPELPFGTYDLYLREQNHSVFVCRLVISTPVPTHIQIDSIPPIENAPTAPNWPIQKTKSHTEFTPPSLSELPAQNTAFDLEEAERLTPGIVPAENEWMHLRGEYIPPQYVIDGIPIANQMTRMTMPLFEPSLIESADLLRGDLDARYGSNGVMNITTKSGFDATTFGHAEYTIGTDGNSSQEVDLGGRADNVFAYYASYGNFSTDRYLDPVTGMAPNHTNGSGSDYFGKINIMASDALTITALGYYGSSLFQIPNANTLSTQDQDNDMVATMFGARMDYELSTTSVLSLTGYTRRQSQSYTSNGVSGIEDSSTRAAALRSDQYFIASRSENFESGGELEYAARTDWFNAHNSFELGAQFEMFPLQQYFTFGVVNPNFDSMPGMPNLSRYDITNGGTPFLFDSSVTGKRLSAYIQDGIRTGNWTIDAGVRYDLYELLDNQSGISPRVNIAWHTTDALTLRASYNSIFQQAPLENYLVSSSTEASVLSGISPIPVQAERSNNFELGANYAVDKYWSLDLSGYYRTLDNMLAEFELDNSGVLLPANIRNGKAYGGELEFLLHDWNHLSGMLSISSCVAEGAVPADGSSIFSAGLPIGTLAESYAVESMGQTSFKTVADEPLAAAFLLRYQPAPEYFFALSGRYDAGVPFGYDAQTESSFVSQYPNLLDLTSSPSRTASHFTLNFSAGYNLSHLGLPIMISGSVVNIFNSTYFTEFDPVPGGAHYGTPREFLLIGELSP